MEGAKLLEILIGLVPIDIQVREEQIGETIYIAFGIVKADLLKEVGKLRQQWTALNDLLNEAQRGM